MQTTKIQAGYYTVDLELSTGQTATFEIRRTEVGDDERLEWIVEAEDAEGRTVVEYGDAGPFQTKREALASAIELAAGLVPHEIYGWVYVPAAQRAVQAAREIVAGAGASILEVRGIRRNASDGGAWMLLDGTGAVEVAPRLPEALTSTQVLDLVASVKAGGFATEDAHLDDLEA